MVLVGRMVTIMLNVALFYVACTVLCGHFAFISQTPQLTF